MYVLQVNKKRTNCKHKETIACSKDVDSTPCRNKCARVLPCGHYCLKGCAEPCGDCVVVVSVRVIMRDFNKISHIVRFCSSLERGLKYYSRALEVL